MNEDQASTIISFLSDLVEEVRGLRADFEKFTSYNTVGMQDAIDGITGPLGYTLGDLNDRLTEVTGAVDNLETTFDLT